MADHRLSPYPFFITIAWLSSVFVGHCDRLTQQLSFFTLTFEHCSCIFYLSFFEVLK